MNKIFTTLNEFASETTLRFDPKFLINYKSFSNNRSYIKLSDLFEIIGNNEFNLEEKNEFKYFEITNIDNFGDGEPIAVDISTESEDPEIKRLIKKILKGDCVSVKEGDILISSVRPYLKKFIFIDKDKESFNFTKAFIHLRSKVNVNSELLYGFIRSSFISNQLNNVSRMGKGYPVLKENDLRYVYFPKIIFNKEVLPLLEIIKQNRKTAKKLLKRIINPYDIINSIFSDFISFNLVKFKSTYNKKNFTITLNNLSNNIDLRFSPKFHNPKYEIIENFLKSQKNLKLKRFLDTPCSLGISPDYDENGKAYYLSMYSLKSGEIDFENSNKLKDNFYNIYKDRFSLRKFDILMARSGKGTIGKVAILLKDVPNIFSDFTIRIRHSQKSILPFFLFYFIQSIFFQENVERFHKGLGNMINIFPSQIENFKIIKLSIEKQEKIVYKINTELNENNKNKTELQKLRLEVDSITDGFLKKL